MALFKVYRYVPDAKAIAKDLLDGLIVVLSNTTTPSEELEARVEALVDFEIVTRNDNCVPPWAHVDYFVISHVDFDYSDKREALRGVAEDWLYGPVEPIGLQEL